MPEQQKEELKDAISQNAVQVHKLSEKELKALDLNKTVFVDSAEQIQIQEIQEMEHIEGYGPVEVTKKVFSHKISQLDKDLKDVCKKFKVTEE